MCIRDSYIAEEDTNTAMDQDEVEVVITREPDGRSREGKIVRIVNRALTKVVGLYQVRKGKSYGFVIPDNQRLSSDIFVPAEYSKGAVDGHKVVVELTSYGLSLIHI